MRILEILREAEGQWVDGLEVFQRQERISQYHTRIFELQSEGYEIKPDWVWEEGKKMNWKRYRLVSEPVKVVEQTVVSNNSSCQKEQRSLFPRYETNSLVNAYAHGE